MIREKFDGGDLLIALNLRDSRPLYEQVKENIRSLVISGALPDNEKLPAVRELASQLAINPNTIQGAYRELENEGYIRSIPGKGSFVCGAQANSARIEDLLARFDGAAEELMYLGFTAEKLAERLKEGGKNP